MGRLTWDAPGERYYEAGVDHGVLYVDTSNGVSWSGLISISESASGGDARPFFIDGYKYLNLPAAEQFEATIEAFSSPREFDPCDGVASVMNGLFATQQPRKPFNLCYRTKIGNDSRGIQRGYKLHLVYNALAAPSDRDHNTLGDTPEPSTLSWSISTKPPRVVGRKPTAHMTIDSRTTPPLLLTRIEDILYGSDEYAPRLPSVQELVDLFTFAYPPVKVVETEPGVYELMEVNPLEQRTVVQATPPPTPLPGEEPILWLDTSGGNYAVPKLVTGG